MAHFSYRKPLSPFIFNNSYSYYLFHIIIYFKDIIQKVLFHWLLGWFSCFPLFFPHFHHFSSSSPPIGMLVLSIKRLKLFTKSIIAGKSSKNDDVFISSSKDWTSCSSSLSSLACFFLYSAWRRKQHLLLEKV